jgi:hypothetical protein
LAVFQSRHRGSGGQLQPPTATFATVPAFMRALVRAQASAFLLCVRGHERKDEH